MLLKTKTHIVMLHKEKNIIIRGEWLTDVHMDHFNHLLKNCSDYRPVETWRIQCLDTIQPVPKDKKHIQILHSSSSLYDGHWVCSYYNTKNIFIYDSLNTKKLHKHHEEFLKRLFPTYDFEKYSVKFPTVQHQSNGNDCGVYAIAFAISLLFNIKPEKVKYNHSLMRSHLIKILESNVIEHFPQDPQYTFQEVLPLAVIKAREVEAIRLRTIRTSQKVHIKNNNDCKINSNKNVCNEINSITINEQIYRTQNLKNKYVQKCFLSGDNDELEKNININKRKYDLENQCINKRLRYMQVLEDNLDKQNLESNHIRQYDLYKQNIVEKRAKQRNRYKQNLEEKRAKKRDRYKWNLEDKRAEQRNRYKQNLEDKRAKQRIRYKQNSEDKCVKERYRYKADLENKRIQKRIRYSKDFQRERDRQIKLNPDRKWLYNII